MLKKVLPKNLDTRKSKNSLVIQIMIPVIII